MLIGGDEKISVEDAIKIFTYNNAFSSFEENIKGSIEKGKLADLVVLDRSILSCPSESIKDIHVEMTVFDGKIVYENKTVAVNGGVR
jgi:predicted amidohydrolase YtcJ